MATAGWRKASHHTSLYPVLYLLAAIRWDRWNRYDVLCCKLLTVSRFDESESRRLHLFTSLGGAPSRSPPRCALAIRLACGRRRSDPHPRWGPFTFPTSLRARHSDSPPRCRLAVGFADFPPTPSPSIPDPSKSFDTTSSTAAYSAVAAMMSLGLCRVHTNHHRRGAL